MGCMHTAPCPAFPCETAPRLVAASAAAASALRRVSRVVSGGGGGCRRADGDRRGTVVGSRRRRQCRRLRHHHQEAGTEKTRLASDGCSRSCLSRRRPPSPPYPMTAALPRPPSAAGYLQVRACTNNAGGPVARYAGKRAEGGKGGVVSTVPGTISTHGFALESPRIYEAVRFF